MIAVSDSTDQTTVVTSTPPSRASRRRRIIAVVVALVLLGGIATVITLRHLDHQYGPIEGGPFSGPLTPRAIAGGQYSEHFTMKPGATVQFIESIANRGSHSVKITSIETNQIVTAVQWSTYELTAGSSVFGTDTPWRDFPAIVPGDYGVIRLLVTIRRPTHCNAVPHGPDGVFYSASHIVHWESLLHSHTTATRDEFDRNIRIC
jgi:hypothetical protein